MVCAFGKIEAGRLIDPKRLAIKSMKRQKEVFQTLSNPVPEDLFCADELEQSSRASKTSRAAGHDGVCAELMHMDPTTTTLATMSMGL